MFVKSIALMLVPLSIILFFACCAVSRAQATDPRLMTDAEYRNRLLQIEAELPKWETAFRSIDPEKIPQLPYSVGKSIEDSQTVGLTEIDNIRDFISMQRRKRTVYGELALKGFLDSLFDMEEEIVWREAIMGQGPTSLEKYGPQISAFAADIGIDAMARVELLEKRPCP